MAGLFLVASISVPAQQIPDNIRLLINSLPILKHDRGNRDLLYQYSVGNLSGLSDAETKQVITDLAERGIGVITFWEKGQNMESRIVEGIRIGRLQQELGLKVVVDATRLLYGFYDGTAATMHVDENKNFFSDPSFAGYNMGCPFSIDHRIPVIKSYIVAYAEAYKSAGIFIDRVTADWEIDGPTEWNEAWEHSKKCIKCQKNIPNINDFKSFQSIIRSKRSALIKTVYSLPVLEKFAQIEIANYGVYPGNGWRYWYDYFENPQPELPHIRDQQALYRPWYDEFTESGFTMAMSVVYTWYPIFMQYPEYSSDYRWFYNMLLVGSNAGKSTPSGIPIATFVHWHTTAPPEEPDPKVEQMSKEYYKELLWHLMLRGHDVFYSWCLQKELKKEMELLQDVYDRSLEYNHWFEHGRPVIFEVPKEEGTVISAIKLGNELLVRRTDFKENKMDIVFMFDDQEVLIPAKQGSCQILKIN